MASAAFKCVPQPAATTFAFLLSSYPSSITFNLLVEMPMSSFNFEPQDVSSLSSLRQGLAQAQEKQRDLAQENAILRESNEKLLSSAFDLEKERQHLARQNALKVQIAQLETTLREVYKMIYP